MMLPAKQPLIVLADDDPDDRKLMEDALKEIGYAKRMLAVSGGQELLDTLRGRGRGVTTGPIHPRLIILDLNMPPRNGFEVLTEIRADPVLRQVPIIIMTALHAEDYIARAYKLGVSGYIVKPTNYERLLRLLETVTEYWFEVVELPTA